MLEVKIYEIKVMVSLWGGIELECPCYSLLMIPYFSLKPLWTFFKTSRLSFWFLGKYLV